MVRTSISSNIPWFRGPRKGLKRAVFRCINPIAFRQNFRKRRPNWKNLISLLCQNSGAVQGIRNFKGHSPEHPHEDEFSNIVQ